ncbi:hypothetical protein PAEPH01_1695 [Pancytospora epiphaga]|nr:hypothetical protein PAEPH01_1695 [Pancytospora epiphaga]
MFIMRHRDIGFFFVLFSSMCASLSLPTSERQNSSVYESLRAIAESDYFSKIEIGLKGTCPRATSKCSAASCSITKTTLKDGSGRIDLLKTREAYSPTAAEGSAEVWADLYNIVGEDRQLEIILSGLRFSISTHIAAFYTKIFGSYFSNPRLFQAKYNKAYKDNFLVLYALLRAAIASLVENPTEINSDVIKLSRRIIKDNETEAKIKMAGRGSIGSPYSLLGVSDITNMDGIYVEPEYINKITGLLKPLTCLSCRKCLLWGTIQIRGLRAAVKAINRIPLTKLDLICLINAFRRVSVTMKESRRLEEARFTFLWLPITYYCEIVFSTCLILSTYLLYLRMRKSKQL